MRGAPPPPRTSLQSSLVQLVLVRRSNHRTVPSSPHDRNVYGSFGTVIICTNTAKDRRVDYKIRVRDRKPQRSPDLDNYDLLLSFSRRFMQSAYRELFSMHVIKEQVGFKHFSQGCLQVYLTPGIRTQNLLTESWTQ